MFKKTLFLAGFLGLTSLNGLPQSANAAPTTVSKVQNAKPVILHEQPGSKLNEQARALNADVLQDAARHHDRPIILIGTVPLSSAPQDQALFVQLQSYRLCGSAGCTTSIYRQKGQQWETLLDAVNGSISILPSSHNGLSDLLIDGKDYWFFDGKSYQDTENTP